MDVTIGYRKRKTAENQNPRHSDLAAAAPASDAGATGSGKAAILLAESAVKRFPAKETAGTKVAAPEKAEAKPGEAAAEEREQVPPANSGRDEQANLLLFLLVLILLPGASRRQTDEVYNDGERLS
ncbi:MAG: hypothetical protein GX167_05160 [Firmicutes bacterium]|nr:hypothetical protein [Bacillota bacterium]